MDFIIISLKYCIIIFYPEFQVSVLYKSYKNVFAKFTLNFSLNSISETGTGVVPRAQGCESIDLLNRYCFYNM